MAHKNSVFKSVLTVMATIIGAGIFALPPLFMEVGFWPGTILFGLITCLILITHLFMVEIVLTHKHGSRLTGFVQKELGPFAHWISAWTYPLQIVGANFAYIILGGEFLSLLFSWVGYQMPVLGWQMVFWAIGSIIVFKGLSIVAKIESFAAWMLILSMLTVAIISTYVAIPSVSFQFLHTWNPSWLPFGVFLFALSGLSVIGTAVDLVRYRAIDAYRAVTIGTVSAAVLSWLFAVTLVIASPHPLSSNPLELIQSLPIGLGWLIPLVGFLAVATSYITTAQELKMTLDHDFRFSESLSWMVAMGVPFLLLLVTNRDFLSVVGTVGAVFGSINGIFVALIVMKIFERHPRHESLYMFVLPILVILTYLIGMFQKLLF